LSAAERLEDRYKGVSEIDYSSVLEDEGSDEDIVDVFLSIQDQEYNVRSGLQELIREYCNIVNDSTSRCTINFAYAKNE
jgi:hypothetical protein